MRSRVLVVTAVLAIVAREVRPQTARPVLVAPGPVEVVLVDQSALPTIRSDAVADSMIARCAARARIDSSAAREAAVRFRAWDFDPAFDRRPSTIAFLLLPVERGRMDCRDPDSQRTVVAARGLRFSSDTALSPGEGIVAATLYRGDVALTDVEATPTPMLFVTPWGDREGAAMAWRFDVPLEALAPAPWGSTDDVYFLVQRDGEVARRRVGIPAASIDSLWTRASAHRAAALPAESPAESRLFASPAEDGALVRAHQGLVAGQLRQPVLEASRRFAGRGLSLTDRRAAAVQLASAFAHAGDASMARHYLGRAYSEEPCLTLNAETPAALARLADPFERETGRCRPRGVLRFALTGGLIPGAARPIHPARVAFGALAVGAAIALWQESQDGFVRGRRLYQEYLAIQYTGGAPTGPVALAAYDEAESARRAAVWLARGALGLLAASVAEGAFSEWRYNIYLRGIRDYGVVRRVP